eukprot:CAMPEP_0116949830 /NCGR_PEP_ID=MMETSP0467-20121206/39112_1 /TAXON_ID=283647 /ORGANISM="Mesodinium pulex, Strain SPMC105" /LENGTH=63 /DNA_ID=CAMNT_0004634469 /DNA_START=324 /DNA_END=515 /DNA_ORIENTATION=+
MREVGADTHPVEAFVAQLKGGSIHNVLASVELERAGSIVPASVDFMRDTFDVCQEGNEYAVAA